MSKERVAIVGGHGQIARLLTPMLVKSGYDVLSIIRREEHAVAIQDLGAEPIVADIESMDARDLAPFLKGTGAVIFAAGAGVGSGARRKRTVDYGGSILSQQVALEAGVTRFLQVSALVVDQPPDPEADHVWKEYVRAKKDADKALRRTKLQWTIVRPGVLTDDAATGKVQVASRMPGLAADSLTIPRADVAAVLAACLELDNTVGKTFDVVSGNVAIREALAEI